MDDRALSLDEHEVGILRRFDHEAFSGTGDEVRHDGVHGDAPTFDQNAGLAGGGERSANPLGAYASRI